MNTNAGRLVICSIGTSIANGCPSLKRYLASDLPWEYGADDLRDELAAKLGSGDFSSTEFRRQLCAELNSLSRLELSQGDEVVLLATDTAEGRTCVEALQTAVAYAFGLEDERAVRVLRITGLQVRNSKRLREVGLAGFVRAVLEERKRGLAEGREIVINPTGGYKGVVPFLSVLGMLFGLRTVYVFEHADALIELPPLPITFDMQLFERVRPALEQISVGGPISVERFYSLIPAVREHERDLTLSFLEPHGDGKWGLSPLAGVLIEMDASGPRKMKVSRSVRELHESLTGYQRSRMELLIARASQPLWRMQHLHPFTGTDLEIYKQGNVPERLAGYTLGDSFYLCEYYSSHDLYEADVAQHRKGQYPPQEFADWEMVTPSLAEEQFASEADAAFMKLQAQEAAISELMDKAVERETLRFKKRIAKLEAELAAKSG